MNEPAASSGVFCAQCGKPNPTLSKHCFFCGATLFAKTCMYCSQVNPHFATFCGSCGRKLVTPVRVE